MFGNNPQFDFRITKVVIPESKPKSKANIIKRSVEAILHVSPRNGMVAIVTNTDKPYNSVYSLHRSCFIKPNAYTCYVYDYKDNKPILLIRHKGDYISPNTPKHYFKYKPFTKCIGDITDKYEFKVTTI